MPTGDGIRVSRARNWGEAGTGRFVLGLRGCSPTRAQSCCMAGPALGGEGPLVARGWGFIPSVLVLSPCYVSAYNTRQQN